MTWLSKAIMGFVALAVRVLYDVRWLAPRPEFDNYGQQAETCRMFHNCCSLAKKLQQFKQSFVKTYVKLDCGSCVFVN